MQFQRRGTKLNPSVIVKEIHYAPSFDVVIIFWVKGLIKLPQKVKEGYERLLTLTHWDESENQWVDYC